MKFFTVLVVNTGKGGGYPIPGNIPGQVEWGSEPWDVVEDVPGDL